MKHWLARASVERRRAGADNEGMKRFARSIVYGLLAQAFMIYCAWMLQGAVVGRVLCWNLWLPLALFSTSQGVPMRLVVGVVAGLAIGVAGYSTAIYYLLRAAAAHRAKQT